MEDCKEILRMVKEMGFGLHIIEMVKLKLKLIGRMVKGMGNQ